jgi:hypothetical protein
MVSLPSLSRSFAAGGDDYLRSVFCEEDGSVASDAGTAASDQGICLAGWWPFCASIAKKVCIGETVVIEKAPASEDDRYKVGCETMPAVEKY